MIEAAAVPETFFTVWHNVFERGGLKAGDWFMVHGGTSGIGTTAIQLAVAFGAKVIATAGSAEKCKACLDLGATRAVNYRTEDFVAAAKEATGGKGVNVTLDMVGGPYTEKNIVAAAEDGRIVQIATLQGAEVTINIARLMVKRVTLTGSTLRPRPRDVKAGIAAALEANVWPLLAARQAEGRDGPDVPARQRRRCPPPHRGGHPHRQDRADGVNRRGNGDKYCRSASHQRRVQAVQVAIRCSLNAFMWSFRTCAGIAVVRRYAPRGCQPL